MATTLLKRPSGVARHAPAIEGGRLQSPCGKTGDDCHLVDCCRNWYADPRSRPSFILISYGRPWDHHDFSRLILMNHPYIPYRFGSSRSSILSSAPYTACAHICIIIQLGLSYHLSRTCFSVSHHLFLCPMIVLRERETLFGTT